MLMRVALVCLALCCGSSPSPAFSEDDGAWVQRIVRACDWWGCTRYTQWEQQRQRVRRFYDRSDSTRVYAYIRRDDEDRQERRAELRRDERRGYDCRDIKRVVGNQHLTISGAKGEADKAWIQAIRFYHGEVFMDMSHARGITYTCSRSSVGETLGQTFTRCEIEARPCKAPRLENVEER